MKYRTQRRSRLRQVHARTKPRHHLDPVKVLIEVRFAVDAAVCGRQQNIRVQREIEIRRGCGIDAEKSRWRDPCHRELNVVDQDGLSRRAHGVAESLLAISETQYGDRGRARPVVLGDNLASGRGQNSQPAEIIAGNIFAARLFGLSLHHQVDFARRIIRKQARKHRIGRLLQ